MAEYRYYLIPDFMSHVFPQQFEDQAPTEFFSNTADLMKRYKQLREMPYNNEYTWNERTNLPYPRLTVGIDRRDPDGAVTVMQVRNGVNYLCDDYRGPFADRNDKQLIEMAKQLVTAVGVDRIRPHYYTEENGHAKPDQVSLMAKYGVTEQDAFSMCRQEGLLSPLYKYSHRGGCWFCPNASMTELRHLYRAHPDLWQLMLELQDTPNKATERFNRNFTFAELDLRFRLEGEQLSFYDQELEVER